MVKRIRIDQLRVGMFVHRLQTGWMNHPFLFNAFLVDDDRKIRKIEESGITEIEIDISKGADVEEFQSARGGPPAGDTPNPHKAAPASPEQAPEAHARPAKTVQPVSVKQEIHAAKNVHSEACRVVHDILGDIRLGKQIQMEQAEKAVEQVTDSIFRNPDALISLGRIKQKDDYTFQHCVSVCALLVSFAKALGHAREVIQNVGIGGLLHDIGKMRVPDEILNKPGKLTAEEFEVMKEHAAMAKDILENTPNIPEIAIEVAAQHHERWNGSGYPGGISGPDITSFGQMAAIVDVYDAITSNRIYHKGMEPTEALRKMFEWRATHFNPDLVQLFIKVIGIYPVGSLVEMESGFLGVVVEQNKDDLVHPTVRVVYDKNKFRPMPPRDIDLSRPNHLGVKDRITGYETPERWGLSPTAFL